MKSSSLRDVRFTPWQRHIWIGLCVALSSQLYFSLWTEGFRISSAAVLYPILLVTVARDSHRPVTGLVTGACIMALRTVLAMLGGLPLGEALPAQLPGAAFYVCYDLLLCLLLRDRRVVAPLRLWFSFGLCDGLSNLLNLTLSSSIPALIQQPEAFGTAAALLVLLAAFRSGLALALLWAGQFYQHLLLREEHEQRYRHLFLMTASLKTELYFLKKDAEDIESIMTHAYRLYEKLEESHSDPELSALALSIARDVHEVKKDNLRIIRGIEEEVAAAYDSEAMALSDLLHILEVSTRQLLGAQRADIRLECRIRDELTVREHYRLLSILKNLVTNAVEAIQSGSGKGIVRVDCRVEGKHLLLQVTDNGPGISPRNMNLLFQVGFSTKFHPDTGAINRGVGLSAVQSIVTELGGTIQAHSDPGHQTQFQIALPIPAVTGGIA